MQPCSQPRAAGDIAQRAEGPSSGDEGVWRCVSQDKGSPEASQCLRGVSWLKIAGRRKQRERLGQARQLQVNARQLPARTKRSIVVSSRSDCVHQSNPILYTFGRYDPPLHRLIRYYTSMRTERGSKVSSCRTLLTSVRPLPRP